VRRFITSLTGKLVSQLVILALLLPYLSLTLVSRAEAQVQTLPSWAVTEFANKKSPGTNFGKLAADAVSSELAKTGQYDVQTKETIDRTITSLGLTSPLQGSVNLMRVGQELRASSIVSGEVVNYEIRNVAGGHQAFVTMTVTVTDVASGLVVNGAALGAQSTARPGDVSDETLIADAISAAANQAVMKIQSQTLPSATILNTLVDSALINQGARSGFKVGQDVIILRGREQVATAQVYELEPDSANIRATRIIKGMKPGDKVRAIFRVPEITPIIKGNGEPGQKQSRSSGVNSNLVTMLLVIGVVAVLLGGGNGSGQGATNGVISEALLYPDSSGEPAIRTRWTTNGFNKGNANLAAWQVWRSDILTNPVLVVGGDQRQVIDTTSIRDVAWADFRTFGVGGSDCGGPNPGSSSATAQPGITPGRAYIYQVELIYALNSLDLPAGGTAGTAGGNTGGNGGIGGNTGGNGGIGGNTGGNGGIGGNTGGNGGIGGNTGGNGVTTGTTSGTTGSTICYFASARDTSKGPATALNRIQLISPAPNDTVSAPTVFSFQSSVNVAFPINVEYVIQFSTSPLFPANGTVTAAKFVRGDQGTLSTQVIDTTGSNIPAAIRNASEVYWRIGARNVADVPGPVPDASGQRYIFSVAQRFTRPAPPPQ